MGITISKMFIKDQEGQGQRSSGKMKRFSSHNRGLGCQTNFNPTADFRCLGIFPEEIWLHVLNQLNHSKDILNVLKAFPELDKSFQRKKACWLFDQVLPHLMTKHLVAKKNTEQGDYVDSTQLLKLRLISKRWKRIVETAIENHADRHPINITSSENEAAPRIALPVNHFNYNRIEKHHMGATKFRTPEQITDFLKEMANFSGNPFPGKHICFEIDQDLDFFQDFAMRGMELLHKFGEHVLVLEMEVGDGNECHLEMCTAILKGLSSAPNLQVLKVQGYLNGTGLSCEATNEYFSHNETLELFPNMEKLKCFDWQVDIFNPGSGRSLWADHMIALYGGGHLKGLRKLALDHKYWNAEMASNLTNLTELHLLLDMRKEYGVGDIGKVLELFPKGQLKKFCLSDHFPFVKEDREIYIDELIGILAKFQIENVVFEKLHLKERSGMDVGVGITSLHLDDSFELSYEFLRRLPHLRFLSVHVPFIVRMELTRPGRQEDESTFAFQVRQYFWKAVEVDYKWKGDPAFDIWKVCDKLEMLSASVVSDYDVFDVQFVREHGNKPFWGWGGRVLGPLSPEEA